MAGAVCRADTFVGQWTTVTVDEALEFVATHGVVLESASGPVPSLASAIVGEPIRGSWWGHPQSHQIFQLTRAVRASPSVLVCRLVNGKVTLVHRRLWPALVCVADRFPADRLAQIEERHTDAGHHRVEMTQFPDWVPPLVLTDASSLTEGKARNLGTLAAQLRAIGRDRDRYSPVGAERPKQVPDCPKTPPFGSIESRGFEHGFAVLRGNPRPSLFESKPPMFRQP